MPTFPATVDDHGVAISRVYRDGGHGQLLARLVPRDQSMLSVRLRQGRWFTAGEPNAIVLNAAAAAALPATCCGKPLKLLVDGHEAHVDRVGGPFLDEGRTYHNSGAVTVIEQHCRLFAIERASRSCVAGWPHVRDIAVRSALAPKASRNRRVLRGSLPQFKHRAI